MGSDVSSMVHQTLLGEAWEHASVAAAIFSDDGRYVACNEAFCALTGYSRAEITKMRVGIDLAVERKGNHKLFEEIVRSGRTTGVGGVRRKDGSEISVAFWAIATRTASLPYFIVLYWESSKRPKRRDLG